MVTPWFPNPAATESGIFVLRDALALSRQHDVRVIHLDSAAGAASRAGTDELEGIAVIRVPFNRRNPLHWRQVLKLVRRASAAADVVHTHALTGIIQFAFRRPGRRTRWVHTEHWSGLTSPETLTPIGRFARRAIMPILARPDTVVVACERLSRTIRTVRSGPIVNIPCIVVPPQAVVPAPGDPELVRLLGVGGLIPRKGAICALETVAELEKRGVIAHLTWVGDGPQRQELVERARELALEDRVTLTGVLPEELVRVEFDRSDLFLLPTLGDNFCIVMAEALSHGRPVVSGADTGAVDYSEPAVSRFVEDDKNPAAYADAVQEVLTSSRDLGSNGIAATVHGRFTPERVAGLLAAVYAGQ